MEIDVTPRHLRQGVVEEAASAWKRARAAEKTPERALRKMREKAKRLALKAAKGEQVAIVARGPRADVVRPRGEGGEDSTSEATMLVPAMRQLNDPTALALLRAMYEFLASANLHHCRNCDEEWVVFNAQWPQAGAGCAGPRAGYCETIARAGYDRCWSKQSLCRRAWESGFQGKGGRGR